MTAQAIRLSIKFFEEIKGFERGKDGKVKAPDQYKNLIMNQIYEILNGGMKADKLTKLMDQYKLEAEKPQEVYCVEDIMKYFNIKVVKGFIKNDPNNLLERGTFYYHPALQVAPPPPVISQLDSGEFVSSYDDETEFFLEMKESFTIEDLIDYFRERMELSKEGFRDRDGGAFKYMLKYYDIDTILYTIDEARALSEDLDKKIPKNPLDIREYFEEGKALLEERKNICYMEGLDRVIPRP